MTGITYHLASREWYERRRENAPYVPEAYADDGFVHCTDGLDEVVQTANRYYRGDRRQYVLLVIDTAKVIAPIRYEDPRRIYPHIYGPIDDDAIVGVLSMPRSPDGTFLRPSNHRP